MQFNERPRLWLYLLPLFTAAACFSMIFGIFPAWGVEPDIGELVAEGAAVATAWKSLGWIAGVTALVNFLVNLTKLKFLATLIEKNDLKWIRPALALALALVISITAGLVLGKSIPIVIVEGVLAGVMAPGFHELFSILTPKGREKRSE